MRDVTALVVVLVSAYVCIFIALIIAVLAH